MHSSEPSDQSDHLDVGPLGDCAGVGCT
jgi:hypothetical protein